MRLTKFNEETGKYELIKKPKTQAEFIEQRKAVIQRLGEYEENAEWIAHRWPARQGRVKGAVKNYTCSACGNNTYTHKTKYCSNCGAKMENLNAEQVKKALELCYAEATCSECPYQKICFEVSQWQIMKDALALINSQEQRIGELEAECNQWRSDWEKNQKRWEIAYDELDKEKHDLELTLVGVMFSVDKWLDGKEFEQDEVNRAITMREKTLQIVEKLTDENERLRAQNETLEINNKNFKYRIYELSRDNEEWEHENKDLECDNDMLRESITEIKADTVRKMQDRLKAAAYKEARVYGTMRKIHTGVSADTIDQIAKEILGDAE